MNVTVVGNIGSDPELKFTKTNTPFVSFSLAYTPRQKQGDDWVDGETMWFRVTQWGEKSEALMDTISKGNKVMISGSLKQSTYKAKDGSDKVGLEINAQEIGVVSKVAQNPRRNDLPAW